MEKIVVTRPILGLAHMQVCALATATDEEILAVCNRDNPSGTSLGWSRVYRNKTGKDKEWAPVQCLNEDERLHFIVGC